MTALLCASACGDLGIPDELRYGDVTGRVLRAQRSSGRVVLMGAQPVPVSFEDDGSFRIRSIPTGEHELLVVANDGEALRVPVTVRGAELTDLSDLDPQPAAFIRIYLTGQSSADECWVDVHRTDLTEIRAPAGSYDFVAGPLAPGCYDASMQTATQVVWDGPGICLAAGEVRRFDVAW